jgi:hypothetical protein
MSYVRNSVFILGAALLTSEMTDTALGQQPDHPSVTCVKRTATAKAPLHSAGPRITPLGRDHDTYPEKTESMMKPVCPEGEVPVVKGIDVDRQVPQKGNPLLRPQGNLVRPPGSFILPGDVRTFREIYGSKQIERPGIAPLGPPGPGGSPACAGVPSFGSCYYYGSAGFTRAADGGGMTMTVARPAYDNSGGPGHSLNEIAVQGGADNGNIVELGWLISTEQNVDADPHIFVFHWKGWNQTCYNGCGWRQYSNTYFPGQNISVLIGRQPYVGYVFYNGNWWAWFDNQWLGYFPGSEWNNVYTKSALLQWFGEVASQNGVPPKTQMGDGILPPAESAAEMSTLCDVDAKAWVCTYRDQQSVMATAPKYYDSLRVGFGNVAYGGQGQ